MSDLVLVKDIPGEYVQEVIQVLARYTIAFLSIKNDCDADLAGSGVLVSAGSTRAILTAQHVIDALSPSGRIGLFLDRTTQPHSIDKQGTVLVDIARGSVAAVGPDLGAVILAPNIAGSIAAKKNFFN